MVDLDASTFNISLKTWGTSHVPRYISPYHFLSWMSFLFRDFMLNFDASVQFDAVRIAFTIRDAYGNVLLAQGCRINILVLFLSLNC